MSTFITIRSLFAIALTVEGIMVILIKDLSFSASPITAESLPVSSITTGSVLETRYTNEALRFYTSDCTLGKNYMAPFAREKSIFYRILEVFKK